MIGRGEERRLGEKLAGLGGMDHYGFAFDRMAKQPQPSAFDLKNRPGVVALPK